MSGYQRILLAVDLSQESEQVAQIAVTLAHAVGGELHVIQVMEPLTFAYGGDAPLDLSSVQEQIRERANSRLGEFAASINVRSSRQHLVFGRPDAEIHQIADREGMDLVVGSHGRHGLALLLGSTANAVLHGASYAVLAVRVGAASLLVN